MRIDVVTIFPRMFDGPFESGVIGRARERGLIDLRVHDLRDYAAPPTRDVDDEVYGGGAGMLFRVEPLTRAVRALSDGEKSTAVVRPTPSGQPFSQAVCRELGDYEQVLLTCDRYEGTDDRLRTLVTHEVSLGDYVLTGGEIAALAIVDAVVRLRPGVVGRTQSVDEDSFTRRLLDHESYTRPECYDGKTVPEVLLSGHHERIRSWRRRNALKRTLERRPELLRGTVLGAEQASFLRRERAGKQRTDNRPNRA